MYNVQTQFNQLMDMSKSCLTLEEQAMLEMLLEKMELHYNNQYIQVYLNNESEEEKQELDHRFQSIKAKAEELAELGLGKDAVLNIIGNLYSGV